MQKYPGLILLSLFLVVLASLAASVSHRVKLQNDVPVRWVRVPDLPSELLILDTVFWEPLDTQSLRKLIRSETALVKGKSVLEIGTGSGLLALCCGAAAAKRVTATDINPNAIRCAKENAQRLKINVDFRLVPSENGENTGAFSVIGPNERFDLIISNPPWENDAPKKWSDFALYDVDFQLLRSILEGCRSHLNPGGRLILAYGCVEAIRATRQISEELGMTVLILDQRDPESLPDVFLPGIALGILPNSK